MRVPAACARRNSVRAGPPWRGAGLVTQGRDLDILAIGTRAAADHAEDPPQAKECQSPHHHGSRSCQVASALPTAAR
jgi:hypothetical protein